MPDKEPFTVGMPPVDYMAMEGGFKGNLEFNTVRVSEFSNLVEQNPNVCEEIAVLMHHIGLIPENWDIPLEKFGVVAYRYPEKSYLDSGIFLTSLDVSERNIMDGLPGSSTETLNNRMYVGFTFLKDEPRLGSKLQYWQCLGNGILKAKCSPLGFDPSHQALGKMLLGLFYPKKEI